MNYNAIDSTTTCKQSFPFIDGLNSPRPSNQQASIYIFRYCIYVGLHDWWWKYIQDKWHYESKCITLII